MKRSLILFVAGVFFSIGALAHDPRVQVSGSTTVIFGFNDGTPMSFALVKVFGPADSLPVLETRTDRAGRVSFLPDRNGIWRAEAIDDQGHSLNTTMSIHDGVPVGSGKGVPDGLVALSLVLNLVLGSLAAGLWRRRRQ